jgi:transposase
MDYLRMMGEKRRDFTSQVVSLEALVPQDNFYRKLETEVDLSFVRDLVRDSYATNMGRPSIDPVVFFKLQLIMFFEGIRSERQLMEMAAMRLDHRWYIGYDLNEAVPNHSSLTHIRDRYGLVVFQRFFERIVELCIKAGLVWGKELYFDGTLSEANADYDKRVPRFYWQAKTHLQQLFEDASVSEAEADDRQFVHKYDGTRRVVRANFYRRDVDYWVSPADPNASPMGKFKLGYRTHYGIDGGKARIILTCLVTPTTIQDNTPMIDLAWWARFRWRLPLQAVVGDQKYGTIDNVVALEDEGVKPFMPLVAHGNHRRPRLFPRSEFQYQAESDCYICPQGETLHYIRTQKETRIYRALATVCTACPLRVRCTTSDRGRAVSHSVHKPDLDRVARYHQTEAYKKAMRKRQVWAEPKFAESKMWHQGQRFRLRRIRKVNIEALLRASVQNLKQLLHRKSRQKPLKPANVQALAVPVPFHPMHFGAIPAFNIPYRG